VSRKSRKSGRQKRAQIRKRESGRVNGANEVRDRYRPVEEAVIRHVEGIGYDPVEFLIDGRRNLRLTIDRAADAPAPAPAPAPGAVEGAVGGAARVLPSGVRIADCQLVSRAVCEALSELGYDPGSFQIEVSSPGIERPLTRLAHFHRFRGQQVTVTLTSTRASDGRRNFTGQLIDADETTVTVHVLDDRQSTVFERSDIRGVKLRPKNDFPSGGDQRRSRRS
jgi:ribosome maturation factor RimP